MRHSQISVSGEGVNDLFTGSITHCLKVFVLPLWTSMKHKKPDVHHRIETTLKLSLKVQEQILATDKLILEAINKSNEIVITIHPGIPRFASKTSLPRHRHEHLHGHGSQTNN